MRVSLSVNLSKRCMSFSAWQSQSRYFLLLIAPPILCCLAAIFLVLYSGPIFASYSRYVSFGITRITYDELSQLVDKTHNFVERANAKLDDKINYESLSIGDEKRTVKLKKEINVNVVKELPKFAYFVKYAISGDINAPITSVEMARS